MSITIVTSAWNHFQKIQRDDFTGIIRHSLSMTALITDFEPKDKERLEWLRDNTHRDIMRSIYELDRYVDPTKGKYHNTKWVFQNGNTYSQDDIQKYLCLAVEEATQLIYKNFKDFKTETKIGLDNYEAELQNNEDKW